MPHDAFGTTFSWNSQVVAELKNINGIELSIDSVDVTTHQSADAFKDSDPGLVDAGEVSIEGLFDITDTTGQHAMLTDASARTTRTGVITFPSSIATWTFTGYITKIKIGDAPVDGKIPFSASIKPKGKPTFAIAASANLTTPFFAMSESAVIVPAPAAAVYTYVATVLTGIASVTITPTATAGVITVNGNVVATGQASSAIALGAAGTVTTATIVVTEANKAPKTYTIYITRAAS
jgi:hypothetical protein